MRTNLKSIALAAGIMLAMAFTFSCSSDGSVGGSKSSTDITIDKRVVGTWIDEYGRTCVFNSDGTGKYDGDSFKYTFFLDKIVRNRGSSYGTFVQNYVFSADGKTFIIYGSSGSDKWFVKKE